MSDQSSDDDDNLKLHIPSSDSEDNQCDSGGNENDDLSEPETGTESENEKDTINDSEQLSSSEWIEFNKKVISMRPLFKSAKVQYAHKASRAIKMLRKKKGTPEQVDRNNKKADRLVQEITYINRLKKDVIAKFALLHSKEEVIKIVNSADSSMEYKAKAKVALLPKISQAAEKYHMMHPDWRDSLFKLMQLAGKNMKKKRRKIRGKSNKGSKINEENRQNAKKQQSGKFEMHEEDADYERFGVSNFPEPPPGLEDSMGRDSASDEEHSPGEREEEEPDRSDDEELDESDGESSSEEVGLILRTPKGTLKRTESQTTGIDNVRNKLGLSDTKKTLPTKVGGRQETKFNSKKEKLGNGAEFNKDLKSQRAHLKSKRPRSENSSDEEDGIGTESKPKPNVDPFFMTSDNKEYKTLWKVEPADSFKNKKPNEPEFMFKNASSFKDVLSGKNTKVSKSKVPKLGKREKNVVGKGQQSEVPLENLHPSWQAKKKLSNVAFQGKKVVFDD